MNQELSKTNGNWKRNLTSYFLIRNSRSGFTIIELLVVLAIISILMATASVLYSDARAKSRDARRERDVKTLQSALSIYATARNGYPLYSGYLTGSDAASVALKNEGAIDAIPLEPSNTGNYRYNYASSDGTTYVITYYLETNSVLGKSAGLQTAGP